MENKTGINIEEIENRTGGLMASRTNDVKRYVIKIGHVNLTVIDTPGFGDIEVDASNIEKIKQIVLYEGGMNCVCVVQSGREARLSTMFRYSYNSLTSILPRAISRQIICVYTKCENQDQMVFDHSCLN